MQQKTAAPINTVVAYAVAVLGGLVAGYTVLGSLMNFGQVNDLPEYYAAAQMILQGHAAQVYYLPTLFAQEKQLFPTLTRGVALFVPPPAVPLLLPLAIMPAALAAPIWTALLVLCLVASLAIISKWFSLDRHEALWLFGLVFLSGPAIEALRLGQLAPLMLLGLTLCGYFGQRHPLVSGLLLDLLVFKPQQLFPILVFSAAGLRKQLLIGAALGLILLLVVSQFIFGAAGFAAYVAAVADPANLQLMQPELNPTIRGQSMRLAGLQAPINGILAGVSLLASVVAIALLGWRSRSSPVDRTWTTLCLGVALPLGLLASLHCHDYDLLLLVPGMVSLMRTSFWAELKPWLKGAVMLGIAAFLMPFYGDIHYGYLLRGGTINPHFVLLLCYALFLLVAALKNPAAFDAKSSLQPGFESCH